VCLSPGEGAVEKQLGLFQSEEAAASAYDTLAIELWGPSTPTNFHPQGVKSAREDAKADKEHGDGRKDMAMIESAIWFSVRATLQLLTCRRSGAMLSMM